MIGGLWFRHVAWGLTVARIRPSIKALINTVEVAIKSSSKGSIDLGYLIRGLGRYLHGKARSLSGVTLLLALLANVRAGPGSKVIEPLQKGV